MRATLLQKQTNNYKKRDVTMKKHLVIILSLVFLLAFTSLNAQSKIGLSVGPELAVPTGTLGDIAGIGFGGTVAVQMNLGQNIDGYVRVGYLTFGEKDIASLGIANGAPAGTTANNKTSAIPLLVGTKYYFGKGGFYSLGEIGLHFISNSQTVSFAGASASNDVSSTEFSYSVGVGYEVSSFDLGVRYTGAGSNANWIGVRAAYKFSL